MAPPAPSPVAASRRGFLKVAGAVAASAAVATVGCAPGASNDAPNVTASGATARQKGFDRRTLDALGDVLLPGALGVAGRKAAVDAFVAWIDGYEPVAEEMHGYGYADVRYLPPDPAPGWRSQLAGLDLLARRTRQQSFADCDAAARLEVVNAALASIDGSRLPDPLGAPHVALALLSHWTNSPSAWNLALGVSVSPNTCRQLDGVDAKPLPIVGASTGGAA